MIQDFLEKFDYIKDCISKLNYKETTFILTGALSTIWTINTIKRWIEMNRYFKKKNLPFDTPLPFLGNGLASIKKGVIEADLELIKKHGKIVGCFDGSTPVILTTDLNFIKTVMIKDFPHFVNRFTEELLDTFSFPFNKGVNNLRDEEWKNARSLISPTFSSGKLKEMTKLMFEVSDNLLKSVEQIASSDGIFDAKKYFGCYTLDVMNSCCFGVKTDSFNDPENEFIKNVKIVFLFTLLSPKMLLLIFAPKLFTFLMKRNVISLLPTKSVNYLISYITQVIELRKNKKEKRNDFIQHMIESEDNTEDAKNKPEKEIKTDEDHVNTNLRWASLKRNISNEDILGHAFVFLAAGYETTASTLSFISYNLAMNPQCQSKLCLEIDDVLEKYNGEISYESVNEMNYLEMVINETLRMYPPGVRIERLVSDKYEYKGIKMEKDLKWRVPVWALHHDPEIYPEPDKFIPERFNEENKKLRDSAAFMPFGAGPRHCIAMRFAIVEMKLLLAKILSQFMFVKCDQTQNELVIDKYAGLLKPLNPILVKVEKR